MQKMEVKNTKKTIYIVNICMSADDKNSVFIQTKLWLAGKIVYNGAMIFLMIISHDPTWKF